MVENIIQAASNASRRHRPGKSSSVELSIMGTETRRQCDYVVFAYKFPMLIVDNCCLAV